MEASLRNRITSTPSRDLFRRAVAYRMQEKVLGGLKPSTRRLLKRVAVGARVRMPTRVVQLQKVDPSTILIREWGGTRHEVTIVENGAMFRGKRYRFTLPSGPCDHRQSLVGSAVLQP
jgi:Protein of unknown function (DUF2924)